MDAITRDEALARIAAFLDQQIETGKQGERLIAVNFNSRRQITSVKATAAPPKLAPLPASCLDAGDCLALD